MNADRPSRFESAADEIFLVRRARYLQIAVSLIRSHAESKGTTEDAEDLHAYAGFAAANFASKNDVSSLEAVFRCCARNRIIDLFHRRPPPPQSLDDLRANGPVMYATIAAPHDIEAGAMTQALKAQYLEIARTPGLLSPRELRVLEVYVGFDFDSYAACDGLRVSTRAQRHRISVMSSRAKGKVQREIERAVRVGRMTGTQTSVMWVFGRYVSDPR